MNRPWLSAITDYHFIEMNQKTPIAAARTFSVAPMMDWTI